MAGVSVQFKGIENGSLLIALGVAVALAMLGYGLWQLAAGRTRQGLFGAIAGCGCGGLVLAAALRVPMAGALQRGLWMILSAGVIFLAVTVFYWAVYAYLGRRRMAALLLLRFLAILSLLLILFKPAISVQPSDGERRLALPVLLDRSGSMNTVDSSDLPSRYGQAVEALGLQRQRLERSFRVGWRHFAARVQSVDSPDDLASLSPAGPETDSTDIAEALRRAGDGYAPAELAGVILISDGLHNASGDVLASAGEVPAPIYVLGVGSEKESPAAGGRNLRLASVDAPLDAVRNNVTTVTAKVRLTGWANIPAKITLSELGKQADAQQLLTESNSQLKTVELKWTPAEPASPAGADIRKLKIAVEPSPAETTPDDNAAELHVLVTQPAIKVLYIEGTMRPEYKFLRRTLSGDPNVRCVSLVRQAENSFLSQGSLEDGKQLTNLPTEAELKRFDVVILGDLDRRFLRAELMEQIRQFVNDGKALLMIGGRTSFGPGGYGDTPIEAALPVLVGSRSQPQESTPFVPRLTAAGAASPIFAGLETFFDSPTAKASQALPPLLGCVNLPSAKAGATVLAIHPSRTNGAVPLTVLAVQQYGAGRSAAFAGDTTWQWFMQLEAVGADSPYHRFWGQLIRWLAGQEKKERAPSPSLLLRLDRAYVEQGENVQFTAQARDSAGMPAAEASVVAAIKPEDPAVKGEDVTLLSTTATGVYAASYRPGRGGKFTVSASATDKQHKPLGEDQLPLIVAPHSRENEKLARDAALLQAIAGQRGQGRASGAQSVGRYAELSALPEIVEDIIQRQQSRLAPARPATHYDLYNFTLLFVVFVALLTVEWALRRSWQLQ